MNTEFQYDVFLSHNQADKPRVRRLAERLRAWFDDWMGGVAASRQSAAFSAGNHDGQQKEVGGALPRRRYDLALERSTVLFRDPANAGRRFIPLLLADCKLPNTLRRSRHEDLRRTRDPATAGLPRLLSGQITL